MSLKTGTVTIPLYGHGLENVGSVDAEPMVTGSFAADPVTGNDGKEYAVFTIADPQNGEYPSLWAGTYRISLSRLEAYAPEVFAD